MEQQVKIAIDEVTLEGALAVPEGAKGIVVFAHGSGSSRFSPRNNFVAAYLREKGLGTLLFDLLTRQEDEIYENRFDIPLLARRLTRAARWLADHPEGAGKNIGFFGSSTGAAAALIGAAQMGEAVKAVVSRGGRPDLAAAYLDKVAAPTLLIVGERDTAVLGLNREALAMLTAEKELALVPGASHLFEEPGTLEEAARLAREWFLKHLA